MAECMPNEQKEVMDKIIAHVLDATNATEQEAYEFALRCWQLNYARVKDVVTEVIEEIDAATLATTLPGEKSDEYVDGFCAGIGWYGDKIEEVAKNKYGLNGATNEQ